MPVEADPAWQHVIASTSPVYIRHEASRPEHVGTGVILRMSDRTFLVSAAHVFDEFQGSDDPHVALGSDLVPLKGSIIRSRRPSLGRQADPLDVVVVEVETESLGLSTIPGLPPSALDPTERDYEGEVMTLVAYPDVLQRPHVLNNEMEAQVLHLSLVARANERDPSSGRVLHMTLGYKEDEIYVDGALAPPTALQGTSGGGLWWREEQGRPRLVAILTDHDSGREALRGTRVQLVRSALESLAPELAYQLRPPAAP